MHLLSFPFDRSAFIWHVVSLVHAARNIQFNEYHAIASVLMREAVIETTDQYTEVIKLLTRSRDFAGCCCGGGGQDTDAINAAIVELNRKCDHMYAVINHSITTADRETGVPSSAHPSDDDDNDDEEEEERKQEEPNNGSEGKVGTVVVFRLTYVASSARSVYFASVLPYLILPSLNYRFGRQQQQ